MKKVIITLAAMALFSAVSFAGESKSSSEMFTSYGAGLQNHNIIVNGGAGVDTSIFGEHGYRMPIFGVSGEFLQKCGPAPLGFGLFINYSGNSEYDYYEEDSYTGNRLSTFNNNIPVGVLVNYHFNFPVKNLDVYAGPRIGANLNVCYTEDYHRDFYTGRMVTDKSTELKASLYAGGAVGATYYFTKMFGANLEAGYPVIIKAAVSSKF